MEELFQRLEKRIRLLLQQCENAQQDKEQLLANQKTVATQIETMITHLKSMEGLS